MSLGYQNVMKNPVNENECNNKEDYGLQSAFVSGLSGTRKPLGSHHALEAPLRNAEENKLRLEMTMLRNTQGLHAPMRLAMELKAANKIGRLPFLPSSFAMRDCILRRDEEITPEDIYNTPEFREQMGQPHAMIEKSLGIL